MDDVSNTNTVGVKSLSSKPRASIEGVQAGNSVDKAPELQNKIEIEMEQADHAFALMTEIRHKLEEAYHELTPPEEH